MEHPLLWRILNLVQQRSYPYSRLMLDQSGRDKVNIRIEYVL